MSTITNTGIRELAAPTARSHQLLGRRLAMWLVVLYPLLIPVVVIPVGQERYSLCELFLPLTGAALLFARPLWRPQLVHWAMAAFLAIELISLLNIEHADQQFSSTKRWLRLVAISVPLFVGLALPVDKKVVDRAFVAFFWGGLVAICIGLVIYWLQIPMNDKAQKLWIGAGHAPIFRASGLVGDTGSFGLLIATWGLASVGALWFSNHWAKWIVMAMIAGLAAYAILASSSRGALINLICGGATLFYLLPTTHWQRKRLIAGGLGLALLCAMMLLTAMSQETIGNSPITEEFLRRFAVVGETSVNSVSSNRLDNWMAYVSQYSDQFLLGTGYKTSESLLPGRTPDNVLLCAVLELGLPGLLTMCLFVGSVCLGLATHVHSGNRYAVILLGMWVGHIMHSMTADTFTLFLGMPPLYLLTGLVLQMGRHEGKR